MPPQILSVTVPFGKALDQVRKVLFQPFDAGKWLIIGFCAWLATLGERGGFGGGFNYGGGGHHGGADHVRQSLQHAGHYVTTNLVWLLPLGVFLVLCGLALWLLILWLSSRGRFMFLHCVVHDVAQVGVPWHRFAAEAKSLFWFRVVLSLLGLLVFVPITAGGLFLAYALSSHNAFTLGAIFGCVGLGFLALGAIMIFWLIGRLLTDFVVPVQFLRRSSCLDAWREFWSLFSGRGINLLVYLLFRAALGLGIGLLIMALVLATCCIAGCLFALPYLGVVFMLPFVLFMRAYPLAYLGQLGPEYDLLAWPPVAEAL